MRIITFFIFMLIGVRINAQNLEVDGRLLVKDINTIATFQSEVKNSFINFATNDDPLRGTHIGYFDDGSDKYFFIDTPEGDFGEFIISNKTGFVGIGTQDPQYSLHIKDMDNQLACSVEGDRIGIVSSGSDFGLLGGSPSVGTYGTSEAGTGVRGRSNTGIGVAGDSNSPDGFDFFAESNDGSTPYGESSSVRWKTNIKSIPDPINKLSQLRGVYFNWKEEFGGSPAIGFIAEEVGKVIPEIVIYEENDVDAIGMDYSKMTPLLVEAVNAIHIEYQEKFDTQQSQLDQLREEMSLLKKMVMANQQISQ